MKLIILILFLLNIATANSFGLRFNMFGSPNLIKNGTFDSDISQWIFATGGGGSFTFFNSMGKITQSDPAPLVYQPINTKINHHYKCKFDLISGSDIALSIYSSTPVRGAQGNLADLYVGAYQSTVQQTFMATTTQSYIGIASGGGANARTMVFDNVSCYEF